MPDFPWSQNRPIFHKGALKCFVVCSCLFLLSSELSSQAEQPSTVQPVYPKTQASIVKENFRKEIHEDARRRLLYYRELVADGHMERARSYLENFLKIYPDFQDEFEIRKLLADSLRDSGQSRLAAEAYVEAYASAPEEERGLRAYLNAARLFADLGEKRKAREILKEIRRRRPSSGVSRIAERELASFPLSDSILDKKNSRKDSQSETTTQTQGQAKGADTPLISEEDAESSSTSENKDNESAFESDVSGKANAAKSDKAPAENTKASEVNKENSENQPSIQSNAKGGGAGPAFRKQEGLAHESESKTGKRNNQNQASVIAKQPHPLRREDLVGEGIE